MSKRAFIFATHLVFFLNVVSIRVCVSVMIYFRDVCATCVVHCTVYLLRCIYSINVIIKVGSISSIFPPDTRNIDNRKNNCKNKPIYKLYVYYLLFKSIT